MEYETFLKKSRIFNKMIYISNNNNNEAKLPRKGEIQFTPSLPE